MLRLHSITRLEEIKDQRASNSPWYSCHRRHEPPHTPLPSILSATCPPAADWCGRRQSVPVLSIHLDFQRIQILALPGQRLLGSWRGNPHAQPHAVPGVRYIMVAGTTESMTQVKAGIRNEGLKLFCRGNRMVALRWERGGWWNRIWKVVFEGGARNNWKHFWKNPKISTTCWCIEVILPEDKHYLLTTFFTTNCCPRQSTLVHTEMATTHSLPSVSYLFYSVSSLTRSHMLINL